MVVKGYLVNPEFINNTERANQAETDWEKILGLENKVSFLIKIEY